MDMFSLDINVYPDTVPSRLQEQHDYIKERCLKYYINLGVSSQGRIRLRLTNAKQIVELHHFVQSKRIGESRCSYHVLAVLQTFYASGELSTVKVTFAERFHQNTLVTEDHSLCSELY